MEFLAFGGSFGIDSLCVDLLNVETLDHVFHMIYCFSCQHSTSDISRCVVWLLLRASKRMAKVSWRFVAIIDGTSWVVPEILTICTSQTSLKSQIWLCAYINGIGWMIMRKFSIYEWTTNTYCTRFFLACSIFSTWIISRLSNPLRKVYVT